MATDDLDFFLLDIVSTGIHGLPIFDIDVVTLGVCLNRHVPHFTRAELVAALVELYEAGDIETIIESPSGRRLTFRPNGNEIEAGIAGAIRMSYRLTPQGGERWARIVGVDWELWDDDIWSTSHMGSITARDREFAAFLFERELRQGNVRKLVSWKEMRPWKAAYWHEEPVGYQVRYRLNPENQRTHRHRFPWEALLPDTIPGPVLSPRRQRPSASDVRPFESLTEKQLESRLNHHSVLTRLAAATELGRRPGSTSVLIEELRRWCPAVRFAAARALGRRRVKEAVPALLGVLFQRQDVAAAEALGRIGDRRALGPLLTVFEWWSGRTIFPDPKFITAVERAIIQFGDGAIGRLERLAGKSPGLRTRVLYALSQSSSQSAVRFVVQQMPGLFYPFPDLLARMGDSGRTHLFEAASDEMKDTYVREVAASALAKSRGVFQDEGRQIAETLSQSRNRTLVQENIAMAITGDAKRNVDNPVSDLTQLLKHPSCAKRRAAVDLLAKLDAKSAAHEIAQLSNDDEWEVRASVARVLARWGQPEDALESLRHDSDIIVRGCARWLK